MSVQFDLSAAHLSQWLNHDHDPTFSSDTREQQWTRAQTYIQTEIIDRLMTYYGWEDVTTASHRKDGIAFVLRGLQGPNTSSVLYIPQRITDLTRISLWTPRLEASNLIARSDATLQTLVPPLVDYFYFLQCILPGSLIITGASAKPVALPLVQWVTNRQQTLKHIFGDAGYRALYASAMNGGAVPEPPSVPQTQKKMKQKKKKSKAARTGGSSRRRFYDDDYFSGGNTGYDWTACSKDHCGWCGRCEY